MPTIKKGQLDYIIVDLPDILGGKVDITGCTKLNEAKKFNLRGIADIDFPLSTKYPNAIVTINVYITKVEVKKQDLNLWAYKPINKNDPNPWKQLTKIKIIKNKGKYAVDYIQATMKAGDPPIAVG